jgi:glutathione S-transferase
MTYKLYGTPGSLYTAKARSYLIKQGLAFENRSVGEARFRAEIVPQIGRWIMPVLEASDGSLIQDGSNIIQTLEARGERRWETFPDTPRHRVIGQIFELFGGEGLLRPAMHYRWNFDDINQPFLQRDFIATLAPGATHEDGESVYANASRRMRAAMASFGVSEASIPAVEAAYEQFLDLFEAHLEHSPYLLGGRPTIGDYGLIGPLYAHLARDTYPADLMKRRAYRVWRWVERMNAPDLDSGDYGNPPPQLFADDGVPQSLIDLLRFVAEDYLPDISAQVGFARQWLEARPELQAGTNGLARPGDRALGKVGFQWRGATIEVAVMPYRLFLLQKVQDAAGGPGEAEIQALLQATGLSSLLTLKTQRRVERQGHVEVWGEPLEGPR